MHSQVLSVCLGVSKGDEDCRQAGFGRWPHDTEDTSWVYASKPDSSLMACKDQRLPAVAGGMAE